MAVELPPGSTLNIRIAKFFTKAKEEIVREPKQVAVPDGHGNLVMQEIINYKKTGKMVTEDWVSYGPAGQLDRSQTPVKISTLEKVMPPQGEFHPAAQAQYEMAQMVLKHYQMWKEGQEMPIDGTPLAAWNGLTHEEVEEFHKRGIRIRGGNPRHERLAHRQAERPAYQGEEGHGPALSRCRRP